MRWQKEVGIMRRDEIRWIPKKPDCEGRRGFVSVGLKEIKPAAFLLLIGYGLSILICVTERLYRKSYDQCLKFRARKMARTNMRKATKNAEQSRIIYVMK